MDAETKEQFRWKFYRLTLQLNAVILLVGLTVMALFIVPDPIRIPIVLFLIVLAVYLAINFSGKYRATKAWLDEYAKRKK